MPKTNMSRGSFIKTQWEEMRNDSQLWDSLTREVLKYVSPNKKEIYSMTPGQDRFWELFDSSAIHYSELLASALHSMLTNPSVQWFELSTGDIKLDNVPHVRNYLQDLVRRIHQILNNTNFPYLFPITFSSFS